MSVIGLDIGTSRIKAVRFDAHWSEADHQTEASVVSRGPHGRSEQDMRAVRAAAHRVLQAVIRRCPDTVDLVAVTAQGDGCWLVDATGEPVRPALLWNDSRAASVVDAWQADGTLADAFAICGSLGAAGLAHAQLRWLLDHEPESVAAARRLLSCGSWVYAGLTGRYVLEASEAANPFLDLRTHEYSDELLDRYGLRAQRALLPGVVSGADRVAPLRPDLARELGLPTSTPVALAPYDVVSTAVGTGVVHVGDGFAVLGTTLCVGVIDDDPQLTRPANGMTLPAADDRWLLAFATMVGTEVLDWTARLLDVPDAGAVLDLAARATASPGPTMLPYLSPSGERSPFLDTAIRGSLHGLELGHTPADLARAAMDALTLCVRECIAAAGKPDRLALSGGGARSRLWCQAISDAVGVPVDRPDVTEVGARGAVLVGSTDLGRFADLESAAAAAVRPGEVLTPRPQSTELFARKYEQFVHLRRGFGVRS